jgi:Flp pilus assembly protein TadB
MTTLYILWLFFAAFFLYFAYLNWRQSREDIRKFTIRNRDPDTQDAGPDADISQANLDFAQDFNRYLDSVNQHNRSRNRAAAIGYTVSGAVALISMGMLLFLT